MTTDPQNTDLLLIDQKQANGSFITKSANLQNLATTLSSFIGGGEDYDVADNSYITIPVAYNDIQTAITLKSDATMYSSSQGYLDDLYVKYPGYSYYQHITSKFIPGWSSNFYLNLPAGTSFYTTSTGTAIRCYLKISKQSITTTPYIFGPWDCYQYRDEASKGCVSSEEESPYVPGVYVWCKIANYSTSSGTQTRAYIYARNENPSTVYYRITGTKMMISSFYWRYSEEKGYYQYGWVDKDGNPIYKQVSLTKKTTPLYQNTETLICTLNGLYKSSITYVDDVYNY